MQETFNVQKDLDREYQEAQLELRLSADLYRLNDAELTEETRQAAATIVLWPEKLVFIDELTQSQQEALANGELDEEHLWMDDLAAREEIRAILEERINTLVKRKCFYQNSFAFKEQARELAAYARIVLPDIDLSNLEEAIPYQLTGGKSYANPNVYAKSAAEIRICRPDLFADLTTEEHHEAWPKMRQRLITTLDRSDFKPDINAAANMRIAWWDEWANDCPLQDEQWEALRKLFFADEYKKPWQEANPWYAASMHILALPLSEEILPTTKNLKATAGHLDGNLASDKTLHLEGGE